MPRIAQRGGGGGSAVAGTPVKFEG
jgi:hypothetical protein